MYIPKNLDINLFFHILKLFSKTIFLTTKWHIRIITIEQIVKHSKFEMKTHGLLKMKEIQGPKRRFHQPYSNCFPWYLLKRSVEILRICCWNSTTLIIWFWRLIPIGAIAIICSFSRVLSTTYSRYKWYYKSTQT